MTTRLSAAIRNAMQNQVSLGVDAGTGPGTIKVYSGSQPATADTAASGTLLVTITLNDPSFGASASGVITADVDPIPTGTAVATGTAGWARVADSDGLAVVDGSVAASGGDFTISTTSITSGQVVNLTGATLTLGVPA